MVTYDARPEPRTVTAGHASTWLSAGWRLFTAAPAIWIAIGIAFAVIHLLLAMVPVLGGIAHILLLPVMVAGLMECSRTVDSGGTLKFELLFSGFRNRTGNLVTVGLLAFAALAVIFSVGVMIVLIGGGTGTLSVLQGIASGNGSGTAASAGLGLALGSLLLASVLTLLLMLPLTLALWFAPALVLFDGMAPLSAMQSSLRACLHNWLALTVHGILVFALAFIAAITVVGLLLIVPIIATSVYLSYRDIYHGASE